QADSNVAQENLGGEFSELLAKLKGGSEQTSDDPATMTPSKGPAAARGPAATPAEWKDAPQRGCESWDGEERVRVGEERAAGGGTQEIETGDVVTKEEVESKAGARDVAAVAAPNADAAAAES